MIPFQIHRRIPFVRRPFFQRDQAIRERDILAQRLAGARGERNFLLEMEECRSFEEFLHFLENDVKATQYIAPLERKIIPEGRPSFFVPGYCAVCSSYTEFFVDYAYAPPAIDGIQTPNWRERLECRTCGLNNRMRAVLHFMNGSLHMDRKAKIYLTEQITPLSKAFSVAYPNVIGSEYLRDGTLPGQQNATGVRHENVTSLTFPSSSFDAICSFDVLEHVPLYRAAMLEFFRCLRPGGKLLLTVPFWPDRTTTITRASLAKDGSGIVHHESPEYHGDPLSEAGALCFYHFGWDLLDDLRRSGFSDPKLNFYWSFEYGYLGGRQFLITASRPADN